MSPRGSDASRNSSKLRAHSLPLDSMADRRLRAIARLFGMPAGNDCSNACHASHSTSSLSTSVEQIKSPDSCGPDPRASAGLHSRPPSVCGRPCWSSRAPSWLAAILVSEADASPAESRSPAPRDAMIAPFVLAAHEWGVMIAVLRHLRWLFRTTRAAKHASSATAEVTTSGCLEAAARPVAANADEIAWRKAWFRLRRTVSVELRVGSTKRARSCGFAAVRMRSRSDERGARPGTLKLARRRPISGWTSQLTMLKRSPHHPKYSRPRASQAVGPIAAARGSCASSRPDTAIEPAVMSRNGMSSDANPVLAPDVGRLKAGPGRSQDATHCKLLPTLPPQQAAPISACVPVAWIALPRLALPAPEAALVLATLVEHPYETKPCAMVVRKPSRTRTSEDTQSESSISRSSTEHLEGVAPGREEESGSRAAPVGKVGEEGA
mmetsp:Transcript_23574/g.72113  ORF Transcript_23574/g.72113 Transcript_23574/m.72113 type:complete len:438 (-) Transcript_23574:1171-2484(-)|eukprot:scaffold117895_cov29-Tisochrysis_lutea.AAC.6